MTVTYRCLLPAATDTAVVIPVPKWRRRRQSPCIDSGHRWPKMSPKKGIWIRCSMCSEVKKT